MKCLFEEAYRGKCGQLAVVDSDLCVCEKHLGSNCRVCKQQVYADCPNQILGLICGGNLCAEHGCYTCTKGKKAHIFNDPELQYAEKLRHSLEETEALARRAASGIWPGRWSWKNYKLVNNGLPTDHGIDEKMADYLAHAAPERILELVEEIKRLRIELEKR